MFQQILDRLIERVPEALAATFNDKDGDPICARTIQVSNEALQLLGAYQERGEAPPPAGHRGVRPRRGQAGGLLPPTGIGFS